MKIHSSRHEYAIICDFEYGPSFGYDINIVNNANSTMDGCSYLGFTYKHPQYEFCLDEADTFLTGSYIFELDEIEVYQKK